VLVEQCKTFFFGIVTADAAVESDDYLEGGANEHMMIEVSPWRGRRKKSS